MVDYTHEDFTTNGKAYDVVFDAVGKHSFRRCRGSLKPGGTFVDTDLGFLWHVPLLVLLTSGSETRKVALGITRHTKDRSFPLEHVVEATRYVETGQKTGKVILIVGRDGVA